MSIESREPITFEAHWKAIYFPHHKEICIHFSMEAMAEKVVAWVDDSYLTFFEQQLTFSVYNKRVGRKFSNMGSAKKIMYNPELAKTLTLTARIFPKKTVEMHGMLQANRKYIEEEIRIREMPHFRKGGTYQIMIIQEKKHFIAYIVEKPKSWLEKLKNLSSIFKSL